MFPGGWETTAQLKTYLGDWLRILTMRGTETGIIDEVNRLHHADDAALDYRRLGWVDAVNYPEQDVYTEADFPVLIDMPVSLVITVTHNNLPLMPRSKILQILREKLIPVDLHILLIYNNSVGYGDGGYDEGGYGGGEDGPFGSVTVTAVVSGDTGNVTVTAESEDSSGNVTVTAMEGS